MFIFLTYVTVITAEFILLIVYFIKVVFKSKALKYITYLADY